MFESSIHEGEEIFFVHNFGEPLKMVSTAGPSWSKKTCRDDLHVKGQGLRLIGWSKINVIGSKGTSNVHCIRQLPALFPDLDFTSSRALCVVCLGSEPMKRDIGLACHVGRRRFCHSAMAGRLFMADRWPVSHTRAHTGVTQHRHRSWVLTTERPRVKFPQTHGLLRTR